MACRIGITTDPESRKYKWNIEFPNMKNWTILEDNISTQEETQNRENYYAKLYKCDSHWGGKTPKSSIKSWCVYYFEYE